MLGQSIWQRYLQEGTPSGSKVEVLLILNGQIKPSDSIPARALHKNCRLHKNYKGLLCLESVFLALHRLDDPRLRGAEQGWRCFPR
jgi:hypothetical protein